MTHAERTPYKIKAAVTGKAMALEHRRHPQSGRIMAEPLLDECMVGRTGVQAADEAGKAPRTPKKTYKQKDLAAACRSMLESAQKQMLHEKVKKCGALEDAIPKMQSFLVNAASKVPETKVAKDLMKTAGLSRRQREKLKANPDKPVDFVMPERGPCITTTKNNKPKKNVFLLDIKNHIQGASFAQLISATRTYETCLSHTVPIHAGTQ